MKNTKLIILAILMGGVLLTSAQSSEALRASVPERRLEMATAAAASQTAKDHGDRFAAAADYLKLALVLGLGMLLGRMSAISHRELLEVKTTLARLAGSSNQQKQSL